MKKNKKKKASEKSKKLNLKLWIICGVSFLVFAIIAILVSTNNIKWFDDTVYSLVSKLRCKPVTAVFKFITLLCDTEFIIGMLLALLIIMKARKKELLICLNTGLCLLLNQFTKRIFLRTRPVGIALIKQGGYSFPSGHSMLSLAFYGLFIYMVCRSDMSRNKKIICSTVLGLVIFLIGLSRIYLGVHYASDVLGGFALSLAYLILFIKFIYAKYESK